MDGTGLATTSGDMHEDERGKLGSRSTVDPIFGLESAVGTGTNVPCRRSFEDGAHVRA